MEGKAWFGNCFLEQFSQENKFDNQKTVNKTENKIYFKNIGNMLRAFQVFK